MRRVTSHSGRGPICWLPAQPWGGGSPSFSTAAPLWFWVKSRWFGAAHFVSTLGEKRFPIPKGEENVLGGRGRAGEDGAVLGCAGMRGAGGTSTARTARGSMGEHSRFAVRGVGLPTEPQAMVTHRLVTWDSLGGVTLGALSGSRCPPALTLPGWGFPAVRSFSILLHGLVLMGALMV